MRPVAAALLLALAACAENLPPSNEEAFQVMENFTMTQTDKGRPQWRLSAPTAKIAFDGRAALEKPEIFFYREGRHASTANALRADVGEGTRRVRLFGDVVIRAHLEQVTLRTETLNYDSASDRVRTEDEVFIQRPGAAVRGKGLEADSALNDITLFKQKTVIQ